MSVLHMNERLNFILFVWAISMECVKSVKIRVTKFVCFAALKRLLEVANKFNCGVHELLPPINNKWSKYEFDTASQSPKKCVVRPIKTQSSFCEGLFQTLNKSLMNRRRNNRFIQFPCTLCGLRNNKLGIERSNFLFESTGSLNLFSTIVPSNPKFEKKRKFK